jgi:hypothetical protein
MLTIYYSFTKQINPRDKEKPLINFNGFSFLDTGQYSSPDLNFEAH